MQTERLLITKLNHQDNAFIIELVNAPGWLKFIGNRNIYDTLDAQYYIQNILDNPRSTFWVVKLKTTQESIGVISLIKRDYLAFHDIGFAFLPTFSRLGYAYEATKYMLAVFKKEKKHPILYGTTLPDNKNSIQLLMRLGFTFEKLIEVEEESLNLYQLAHDV
ncbi:GNAT family N-acetyltransferase [Myroides odoratus]|uniref:GNAT family N-acetyltransferase n=1 Tax=Myroides odoratus TaxID=256 RepID=UPI0039AF0EDD